MKCFYINSSNFLVVKKNDFFIRKYLIYLIPNTNHRYIKQLDSELRITFP